MDGGCVRDVAGDSAPSSRRRAWSDVCYKSSLVEAGKAPTRSFVRNWLWGTKQGFIVLLVDSEGPVAEESGPWLHLRNRDGWSRPDDATDENAHLMVQFMEAWFLADKDRVEAFFGRGFNRNAFPGNQNIEEVAKADVLNGLKNATRQCQPKGEYGKGRNSFELLFEIDPSKVQAASPHAERLISTLRQKA